MTVRNCGDFYVYHLPRLNTCQLRYCGNGRRKDDFEKCTDLNIVRFKETYMGLEIMPVDRGCARCARTPPHPPRSQNDPPGGVVRHLK